MSLALWMSVILAPHTLASCYFVAEIGKNVSVRLQVRSGRSKYAHVELNGMPLFFYHENIKVYENQYTRRIQDLSRHAGGFVSFVLTNVTIEDAGVIKCVEENKVSCREMLVVTRPPEIQNISSPTVSVGNSVTLTCNARSQTKPPGHNWTMTYSWQKDKKSLPSYNRVSSRQLTLLNVTADLRHDRFRCQAHEGQGYNSSWSEETTLDLQYPPIILTTPRNSNTESLQGHAGDDAAFIFLVDAHPAPHVTLPREDEHMEVVRDGSCIPPGYHLYNFTFTLKNLTPKEHRSFSIFAKNIYGETKLNIDVKVKTAPTLFPESSGPISLQGTGTAAFWEFCLWAYPRPVIERTILLRPNRHSVLVFQQPTHLLLKENVHKYSMEFKGSSYFGTYVFQFRNGIDVRNVSLTVVGKYEDEVTAEPANLPLLTGLLVPSCGCLVIISLVVFWVRLRRKKERVCTRYDYISRFRQQNPDDYSTIRPVRQSGSSLNIAQYHFLSGGEATVEEELDPDHEDHPYARLEYRHAPVIDTVRIEVACVPPPTVWTRDNNEDNSLL